MQSMERVNGHKYGILIQPYITLCLSMLRNILKIVILLSSVRVIFYMLDNSITQVYECFIRVFYLGKITCFNKKKLLILYKLMHTIQSYVVREICSSVCVCVCVSDLREGRCDGQMDLVQTDPDHREW